MENIDAVVEFWKFTRKILPKSNFIHTVGDRIIIFDLIYNKKSIVVTYESKRGWGVSQCDMWDWRKEPDRRFKKLSSAKKFILKLLKK